MIFQWYDIHTHHLCLLIKHHNREEARREAMQAYVNTLTEGRLYDLMSRQRKKEIDDLRRNVITDLLQNFTLVSYMMYL